MKNTTILAIIAIAAALYFFNKDSFSSEIYFSGEKYTLSGDTGKKGMIKTYQYTTSGKNTGLNDYVQMLVVEKNAETLENSMLEKSRELLTNSYRLESYNGSEGKFGIFKVKGSPRDYYAYFIERDTNTTTYLMMFIIQSNFDANKLSGSDAKNKSSNMFYSLDEVFNQIAY